MKIQLRRWVLGFVMLFVLAGVYTPPQAEAQIIVQVGHGHHHHHHHRYHHRHHYRR